MAETILGLIPTLGFPAVCLIAAGVFIYKIWMREQEQQDNRENKLMEQMEKFACTMDKFNETLIKIDARLEIVESKLQ